MEESERRLQSFAERLRQKGLSNKRTFKMQESQAAFKTFWELNMCILNLKKVHSTLYLFSP